MRIAVKCNSLHEKEAGGKKRHTNKEERQLKGTPELSENSDV